MNWRDFLGTISGYKQMYESALAEIDILVWELNQANATIRKLREIAPHPVPPEITYIVEQDSVWVQQQLEKLGANITRLPLDGKYRLTDKNTFLDIIAWDWVDSWEWVKDVFDCENHAIAFKAHVDRYFGLNQVGIVIDYQAGHAYNLVIFPDGKVMLFEPQSDQLFVWQEDMVYILKDAFVLI